MFVHRKFLLLHRQKNSAPQDKHKQFTSCKSMLFHSYKELHHRLNCFHLRPCCVLRVQLYVVKCFIFLAFLLRSLF